MPAAAFWRRNGAWAVCLALDLQQVKNTTYPAFTPPSISHGEKVWVDHPRLFLLPHQAF